MTDINTVNLLNQIRQMSIEAQGPMAQPVTEGAPFGDIFQKAISEVSDMQNNTDALKTRFEMGDSRVSLGQVMVESQKASVAFEATVRVRNKLVQAYQDIMDMPV